MNGILYIVYLVHLFYENFMWKEGITREEGVFYWVICFGVILGFSFFNLLFS
jgi:hypothetical protein